MDYMTVKLIHVLSSTMLFGTGLGIAFFMWMAHLSRDIRQIAATARWVVIADTIFTAPAVLTQLLSGLWMMRTLGMPADVFWIKWSLVLFFVIGACWLPVVWLQIQARNMAQHAVDTQTALPATYERVMRWWFWLGWPAFICVVCIFWFMVNKPG